jgi:hypothetical protein
VTLPSSTGTLTAKVRRIFEKRYTSPWNWGVLYNDPMEISPNTAITLNGWVHSNGNVYTGSNKLTLTDRLTSAGTWSVGFAPDDSSHTGSPTAPTYPADLPPGKEQYYAPFGWDPTKFNTTDANPNNDGFREMIERPVSGYSGTDVASIESSRFYNQAGIKILVNGSNVVTVYNQAGTQVTSSSTGNNAKIWQAVQDSIRTNQTFQDNREAATIRAVTFDVKEFKDIYSSKSSYGWNGIIYIADTSATSTAHRAVRIKEGYSLPSGGITIASENPIYVQGDYNTGGNSPPSNNSTPDPTQPTVSGYTAQPAAIIGDAITVLSKDWQDTSSGNNLSNRKATSTTINAALMGGIVPTNSDGLGTYSGGVENFTRFLEDWTGKSFTYHGSMIELFPSQQGVGVWGKAAVYNEPANRFWYFDPKLSTDGSGNPVTVPGYVSTVAYLQQQRWYLEY